MSLVTLALVLSAAGVLVTAALVGVFLYDTETGLRQTTHRAEDLPKVMTDRYIAMAALALGATLYGDLNVIAFLFAAFAFMGFADALIYARGGHHWKALGLSFLIQTWYICLKCIGFKYYPTNGAPVNSRFLKV